MPVAKQVTVTAANRPGSLARIGEALAARRINITGLDASGPQRQIRLLVSNPAGARRALAKAGFRSRLENVVVVTLGDRPGTLGRAARKLAKAGVNINYAYGSVPRGGKRAAIVFGVANPARAARLAR
ncbi:MAG: ACT domain-containing protein [Candidatus Acidiferrales bacterium]